MKKLLLGVLLTTSCSHLNAQNPAIEWVKKMGGVGNEFLSSMETDASGNIYIMGTFSGTTDFDPSPATAALTSAGTTNMYFAKYDSNGNYIWAKQIAGADGNGFLDIAVDASENVYIAGGINSGVTYDFDPSAATANINGAGLVDIYVAKYSPSGAYLWVKKIGGAETEFARSLDVDPAGNVYVTGIFRQTLDFDPGPAVFNLVGNSSILADVFITKFNTNGDFVWAKGIGNENNQVSEYIKVNGTNLYITGYFDHGTVDFDPGTGGYNLVSNSSSDVFLLKLDLAGNFVWVRNLGGRLEPSSIDVDANGNVYTSGWFGAGTIDFDPGTNVFNMTNSASPNVFISKLDANGNFVWAKMIEGGTDPVYTFGDGLVIDSSGDVYLASSFEGTVSLSLSSGATSFTSNGSKDHLITKLGSNGAFLWVKSIGGPGQDHGIFVALNPTGALLASGVFQNTVAFDSYSLSSAGSNDLFILKFDTQSCTATTVTISASDCTSYTVPSGHETYNTSGTYTDTIPNAAGCDSIITINLTINDGVAPVANMSSLPNVTDQCSVTTLTVPTATDNCAGTITGTHNATLPITTQGTTVVTWTYNDGNGNSSTQTQNVIIADNTAPVANTTNLSDITNQCSVTSLTAPTATDNCAGAITGTTTTTFPITTQGTTVVTWTYNDGHGNSSTQTQNVIIADNTAPVANAANLPNVTGQCSVATLTAPTATDNCAGTITGTHSTALPITTPGTTVVTWTYNDGHGNSSTQTQNVIITLPVATTTVSGLTITATTSGATYQWINCGNGNTPIAGATAQSFTATANGTYAVTVTQNGCSATSACATISTVGLEDLSKNLFSVYPNPNTGTFKIVSEVQSTIAITNATGQVVSINQIEAGENTIELLNVESGVYFISATDSNGQVIVQRISIIR